MISIMIPSGYQLWCMLLQRMTKALPVNVAWRFTTALKMTCQVLKSRPNQVNQPKMEVVFIQLLIFVQNIKQKDSSYIKYSYSISSVVHLIRSCIFLEIWKSKYSRYLQEFAKDIYYVNLNSLNKLCYSETASWMVVKQ